MKSTYEKNEEEKYNVELADLSPKIVFFSLCKHLEDVSKRDLEEIWAERSQTKDYYFKRIRKENKFDHGLEIDLSDLMKEGECVKTRISSKGYDKIYGKNSMQRVIKGLFDQKARVLANLYHDKNVRITQESGIKSGVLVKEIKIGELDQNSEMKNTRRVFSLKLPLGNVER